MTNEARRRKIPIRVCSWKKGRVRNGSLAEIYKGGMMTAFFRAFGNVEHAILSRKHGICLSGDVHERYSNKDEGYSDEQLLKTLKEQAKQPRFANAQYLYWNYNWKRHDKWERALREAGFDVSHCRTLEQVKREMDDGMRKLLQEGEI